MWLYTTYGFYSVVRHKDWQDRFMVRARERKHLEDLLTYFWKDHFGDKPVIKHTPEGDYAYRITVHWRDWIDIVGSLADQTSYENFKNACHDQMNDSDYDDVLFETWWAAKHGFGVG